MCSRNREFSISTQCVFVRLILDVLFTNMRGIRRRVALGSRASPLTVSSCLLLPVFTQFNLVKRRQRRLPSERTATVVAANLVRSVNETQLPANAAVSDHVEAEWFRLLLRFTLSEDRKILPEFQEFIPRFRSRRS